MPHIEFRGDNDIPYVYESHRGGDGEPHNIYIGPLDEWYTHQMELNIVPPDLTSMMSVHDFSDPSKRGMVAGVRHFHKHGSDIGIPLRRARIERAGKIAEARTMKEHGKTYKSIAEKLGVSTNTAWRYVNEH